MLHSLKHKPLFLYKGCDSTMDDVLMLQLGVMFQCDFKSILINIYQFDTNMNDIVESRQTKWNAMKHLKNSFQFWNTLKVTMWCLVVNFSHWKSGFSLHERSSETSLMLSKSFQCWSFSSTARLAAEVLQNRTLVQNYYKEYDPNHWFSGITFFFGLALWSL